MMRFRRKLERERDERLAAARFGDLHGIADALQQIVWTATPRGEIDFFNRQWHEYTGKPSGDASLGWAEVVHPDDIESFLNWWKNVMVSASGSGGEFRLCRWDGHLRWHRIFVQPMIGSSGAIVAWFATATDIDDERAALDGLRRNYEHEKRVADTLQRAFLSQSLAQTPSVVFHGSYVPAASDEQVGGDWFDATELPDGRVLFSIGDVAGHGLDAAVTMNRVRQAILTAAIDDDDPASVLATVNAVLLLQGCGMVTALCGYIDAVTFSVRYASAGHPAPILYGTLDGARVLPLGGLPLGITEEAAYATHAAVAEPNSLMVVYTDGLIEWKQNPIEGEQELLRAVSYVAGSDRGNAARAIHNAVFKGALPVDDVAIMTASFMQRASREEPLQSAREWRRLLSLGLRARS